MYHVVIGVDDDVEHALACVQGVTNLPGDAAEKEVTLVHSFTDNPSGASATQIHSVREASEYLEDHGIDYDVNESSGDPAEVIIDFAEEEDADLIVTAGRKRSPAGKALFGSVTQSVILNTDRPVMVTGTARGSE
ncbi:universal stress protein [Haloferax mediterranei ATCC 33500]|uniref:Stress response protein-like protein n=1 Tax=Haloferax mediterranei (strain ATCC 33500 / DSM 1411 / JCM 8866 / NBRC 14739 / NCIMB 2177 / R-4) TaxID=523841 RepID=I3R2Y5_HALMT|nr:universal stress protein [Haloferax mediterranei]AFK18595.1 stress response protein-like protein [Haloferax mediterranei ATCC 33500]AHZ22031.1 universal stress protein UspA [Haloferax mediterranei ATCC 33500]EMA02130.1 stress response protein-like protein [Haloferax mediterranei ATCC 33500]MDX5988683.1 universal stress protein [Haloferax mediterranei ATCC 33500]QCQ75095.1 universal stress protein [Haloferax mediterranei ATCC 33500]